MHVPGTGHGGAAKATASRRLVARGSGAPADRPRRSWRSRSGIVLAAAALLLTLSQVARATYGAYSDTTSNPSSPNSSPIDAGTVTLGDDDSGSSMFNVTGMLPHTTATKCINVVYTGSLNASVRLYGDLSDGGALAPYLDLLVERSTGGAGGPSHDCTGFVEAGKTTVWSPASGTLATFLSTHTSYASGADTWAPAAAPPSKTVTYRFTVTLREVAAGANKSATVNFRWESNNL